MSSKKNALPYEDATSGANAMVEIENVLAKFGCQQFGTMTDVANGKTILQFTWRERGISLEASWKGYAAIWLKRHPYINSRSRMSKTDYEAKALAKGKVAVCSILRDWVKGQITAVECGILSFDTAFLSHMMLPSGERVVDYVTKNALPALPER